jgi:hypothetical protein
MQFNLLRVRGDCGVGKIVYRIVDPSYWMKPYEPMISSDHCFANRGYEFRALMVAPCGLKGRRERCLTARAVRVSDVPGHEFPVLVSTALRLQVRHAPKVASGALVNNFTPFGWIRERWESDRRMEIGSLVP